MKNFIEEFGRWLRHKIRVIIIKQWKKPKAIDRNLQRINRAMKCGFSEEDTFKVANSRRGWYAKANGDVVNYILSPKVLSMPNKKEGRPGLVDPLEYYLKSGSNICDYVAPYTWPVRTVQ